MAIQKELQFFPVDNANKKRLSIEQIESFNKNGFIFPITVFNSVQIGKISNYFNSLLDSAKKSDMKIILLMAGTITVGEFTT